MKRTIFPLLLLLFSLTSCFQKQQESFTSTKESDITWYTSSCAVSDDKIDLFYLVSTNIPSATDSLGHISYLTQLTQDDKNILDKEFSYIEKNVSQQDFNFFAPYYHQFTFDAINLSESDFNALYKVIKEETFEAFDHYMKHKNNGRRFVLAGFSQGGMLVVDLLKHMSEKQYQQLIAAYTIGYRITEEDLQHPNVKAAKKDSDTGVTISFNSVLNKESAWPRVSQDAATCINPVNWKTDTTTATFLFDNHRHTAQIDADTHLLIIQTDEEAIEKYHTWNSNPIFQKANINIDCLHHWDLLFYTDYIHDNIQKRANGN